MFVAGRAGRLVREPATVRGILTMLDEIWKSCNQSNAAVVAEAFDVPQMKAYDRASIETLVTTLAQYGCQSLAAYAQTSDGCDYAKGAELVRFLKGKFGKAPYLDTRV